MTPRQQRFVEEYLVDLNATQAAMRAGYSKRTSNEQGARLLANASIAQAVQAAMEKRSERTEITSDRILQELAILGFADMGTYVRFEGSTAVLDWSDLPPDATKAISEITQEVSLEDKGDDAELVRKTKFKLHDKRAALVDMGRHLGMFTDNILLAKEVHWIITDETMNESAWTDTHLLATPTGTTEGAD